MTTRLAPPPADVLSFTPNRTLLNPKFQSYKLDPPTRPDAVSLVRLPLPGFRLRTFPDHARLSYAEVQARARHNHLAVGQAGELVYFDADLSLIAVDFSQVCTAMSRDAGARVRFTS